MRSIQTLEDLREAWPLITGSEAPAHGTPVFAEPQGCVAWAQQAPAHITPLEQEAQHPATTHQTEFPAQQHQQRSNVSSRADIEAEHEYIVQSECEVPLPPPQVELPEFELPGIWLCTAHLDS